MLRAVAAVSLVYDTGVGLALCFFRDLLQAWFAVPAPQPPIHVDLNALFVTVIGVGYVLPLRDPVRYRAYLWLFGVALKAGGALLFVLDYALRGSTGWFLLFAASDGALAALTLIALTRSRNRAIASRAT